MANLFRAFASPNCQTCGAFIEADQNGVHAAQCERCTGASKLRRALRYVDARMPDVDYGAFMWIGVAVVGVGFILLLSPDYGPPV